MKKITIFLSNTSYIEIIDDDDESIIEYSKKITDILKSNNISILHTSNSSIIIRPNEISAIKIDIIDESLIPDKEKEEKNNNDEFIDTITD